VHDRLEGAAGPPVVVARDGGGAGHPGQAQDGDGQIAQAGHDARPAGSAELGAVLIEVHIAPQCSRSSMPQWPRMMAASWVQAAWVTVGEVTA
jgi:hypothetical protein